MYILTSAFLCKECFMLYSDIVLFVDDTSLIFKMDRKKINYDEVNSVLSRILHWSDINNVKC